MKIVSIDHIPVLTSEVIEVLGLNSAPLNRQVRLIDATVGAGGHSREFLKRGLDVLGIDADKQILKVAEEKLSKAFINHKSNKTGTYKLTVGNFKDIANIARNQGFNNVDAILMDLGISSLHYNFSKGFSYKNPMEPLDMRISPDTNSVKASDLINVLREDQLNELFGQFFFKAKAKRITNLIVEARKRNKIENVSDLNQALGINKVTRKSQTLTKVYMALRIAVNSELANLEIALPQAFSLLKANGRLAVISFHSLEDRIVKNYFKKLSNLGEGRILTSSPITASEIEIGQNPRSRSAKLRCIEKK